MEKIKKILKKLIGLPLVLALIGIIGALVYVKGIDTKADGEVYVTFTEDKDTVFPGEDLTYTVYVQNQTDGQLTNVLAATFLDSKVDYVEGSSVFHRGDETFNIPDSWIVDRFNMGVMEPDQINSVVFKVNVPEDIEIGYVIHSSGSIEPEGWPIQQYGVDATVVAPEETTEFEEGDIFLGANVTTGEDDWHDPVSASMGNIIEYKFRIVNIGGHYANNVKVRVELPWDSQQPSMQLVTKATATAENADSLVDTMTVNLTGQPSFMWPLDGHYTIIGVTEGLYAYNCPNGCDLNNQFLWEPLPIGNMEPGSSVEVLFKASVFNIASPSPTPTPTPTPTATPGPTATPTPTGTPQVLAAVAPEELPQAGFPLVAVVPGLGVLGFVGKYLIKRFKLI